MFFLNLSVAEFVALFGALSSAVVVLYLLDRSRRKQVVSTLRFWVDSPQTVEKRRRKRIQQPWSLLLQLVSLALLLLAIAQPRLGAPGGGSRDHVLILDTSSWMNARAGNGILMDRARAAALRYLGALPAADRVMLVRAEALASPATVFESSRRVVEEAVRQSQPGHSVLQLGQAFEFAAQALGAEGRRGGEIVFVGSARTAAHDREAVIAPPNLRVLPIEAPVENCGIRKIGMRRSPTSAGLWEIFVSVRNYGSRPRTLSLALFFGGAPAGTRRFKLAPGEESSQTFGYRTHAAGWLEARLDPRDDFDGDDYATIELPAEQSLRVAVYSNEPAALKPALAASPRVEAVFRSPAEYQPGDAAPVVILDRFLPPSPPAGAAIWIEPPQGSPFPPRGVRQDVRVTRWRPDHELGAGLRARDLRLDSAVILAPRPGDAVIAEAEAGPVLLARPGPPRQAAFGFHPGRSSVRFELTTPLLFANVLHWLAPGIFRLQELHAGAVGAVTVDLEREVDPAAVRVATDGNRELPFTIDGRTLRFFCGTPATVRVAAGDREMVYSLTLPELGETKWEPPKSAALGLAGLGSGFAAPREWWRLLALLGLAGLLADWLLFGRRKELPPAAWPETAARGPLRRAS